MVARVLASRNGFHPDVGHECVQGQVDRKHHQPNGQRPARDCVDAAQQDLFGQFSRISKKTEEGQLKI